MSDGDGGGTVNHLGQVFNGADGSIHPNLYVAKGSIIPTALGVNPYITISALADRIRTLSQTRCTPTCSHLRLQWHSRAKLATVGLSQPCTIAQPFDTVRFALR